MLNFSNKIELSYLAELAQALARVSPDLPYFLAGATARDLLLEQAHNINPGRNTRDIDLALMVSNWPAFELLRSALLESGPFSPVGTLQHKLTFNGLYELDLIPFGAIEQADRTIAWPPEGDIVMGVFGFQEVFNHTLFGAITRSAKHKSGIATFIGNSETDSLGRTTTSPPWYRCTRALR